MGYTTPADINIVDEENSTATPLVAFDTFVGEYKDVSAYSSISVSCKSDVASQFNGLVIEWSSDGINADLAPQRFTFDPAVISQDGFRGHATVAAKFYRIRYENNFSNQTTFVLTTLLRKGTPAGTVRSIDPVNTFTTNLDVQTVQSITSGKGRFNAEQVQIATMDDSTFGDGPYLFVSPRPMNADNVFRRKTTASLTPVLLNTGLTASERATFISVTNHVLRGNLFIQMNTSTGLTTTNYDFKIPPDHSWNDLGAFGSVFGGPLYGVWDEVYIQSPTIQEGHAAYVAGDYSA